MKTGLRFLLAATVSLVTATGLQASPITYTYIGQNFNQFSQTGPGPSNDISVMSAANYVTASLTMNGPISSEGVLGDFSAQVLDWSMTVNGPQGYTVSAAQGRALNFTDMTNFAVKFQTTGGVISAWDVFVDPNLHPNNAGGFPADPFDWQLARIQTASSGVFSPSQLCACPYLDGALTGSFSSQTFNQAGNTTQGQWSDAPAQSEVPEPASLVLLGTGLVFGVARYRKSRTAA